MTVTHNVREEKGNDLIQLLSDSEEDNGIDLTKSSHQSESRGKTDSKSRKSDTPSKPSSTRKAKLSRLEYEIRDFLAPGRSIATNSRQNSFSNYESRTASKHRRQHQSSDVDSSWTKDAKYSYSPKNRSTPSSVSTAAIFPSSSAEAAAVAGVESAPTGITISSTSDMSALRIDRLLQQQVNLSNQILEFQQKKNALDEKKVSLSEQLLQAQLRNNQLNEERNAMLMLSLVPFIGHISPTESSTMMMAKMSKDEKDFLEQMRQKYFLTPKPNDLTRDKERNV